MSAQYLSIYCGRWHSASICKRFEGNVRLTRSVQEGIDDPLHTLGACVKFSCLMQIERVVFGEQVFIQSSRDEWHHRGSQGTLRVMFHVLRRHTYLRADSLNGTRKNRRISRWLSLDLWSIGEVSRRSQARSGYRREIDHQACYDQFFLLTLRTPP